MRAGVEARPADFRRGVGRPTPLPRPHQQFGASLRQEAQSIDIHPYCKQLSGQDKLGNFVTRRRLSMSIWTTPTNNSKKNTLSFEQSLTMPSSFLLPRKSWREWL